MKKIHAKRIVIGFIAAAITATTAFTPATLAATTKVTSESKLKDALYALAAYDCVSNYGIKADTAIGNDKSSVVADADAVMAVGAWIGNGKDTIPCKEALTKTFGSGKIAESSLDAGNIFNGVYEKQNSTEQKIKCNYRIINDVATGLIDGTYSWPQGFRSGAGDTPVDERSKSPLWVVFNENGAIRLEGNTNGIAVDHALQTMNQFISKSKWADPPKICQPLVTYAEPFAFEYEGGTYYDNVLSSTDTAPFKEFGIHVSDAYSAWVVSTEYNTWFTYTLQNAGSSTALKVKGGDEYKARTKLMSNIASIYLGGATNIQTFLSNNPDAKYILYGRYLFNGDGKAGFACNGTSIATTDPNFSEITKEIYWGAGQEYVASVEAYASSTATSKSSFRTKFGGNGLREPGSKRSINFPGVYGDCKALANEFNGLSTSSNTAKSAVAGYMKVATVEELPDANAPNTTTSQQTTNSTSNSNTTNTPNGNSASTVNEFAECFRNASSLGWILCPATLLIGKATGGIYSSIEQDFLITRPEWLDKTKNEGVYNGWTTFRESANILFAILLVIVILSQVTGFGITNYGIKKILPTLIMVAILVNLSFFLCQVLVDISNILGSTLKTTFQNLTVVNQDPVTLGDFASGIAGTLMTGAALWAGGAVIAGTWELWILPLLLAMLAAFISMLFFYLLLAVRQALIIILVIVSPLAVVCYALPNTKKAYERWWKLFWGLLVLYPICGALMGGTIFASRILLTVDNTHFFFDLTAVLLQIVPIFFIPTLLRSSMSALGQLGTKIGSFGNRLGANATGALRRSDGFQDMQTHLGANRNLRNYDRINSGRGAVNRLSRIARGLGMNSSAIDAFNQRRAAQAAQAYNAVRQKDTDARFAPNIARDGSDEARMMDASTEMKYNNSQIQAAEDSMVLDNSFNHNDLSTLRRELNRTMDAINSNPSDTRAQFKARALANMMARQGKTGEDELNSVFNQHAFDQNGQMRQTAAASVLSSHINNDSKMRTSIKDHSAAQDKILQSYASGATGGSLADFQATLADTTNDFAGASKDYYRGLNSSLDNTSVNWKPEDLQQLQEMATGTLTDPQLARSLKTDTINSLNDINQKAYAKMRENYIQSAMSGFPPLTQHQAEANFISKFGDTPPIYNPRTQQPTP